MWVVKLGGSLWDSETLPHWLDSLCAAGQPLLIVPGGGPFADQVRHAQARWHFDDDSAHRMALLAMDQMALLMSSFDERLVPVHDFASIADAVVAGRVPVWQPNRMLAGLADVEASWEVTSDSLAAWLAARLRASGLILVKSAELREGEAEMSTLQRLNVLDEAFDQYFEPLACPVWLVNRAHSSALESILDAPANGGIRIAS